MTRLPHVDYHLDLANLPWRVRSIHLTEQLDAPFTAELHLLTTTSVTPSDLLLAPATLTFRRGDTTRTFRGEVTRARVVNDDSTSSCAAWVRIAPTFARLARSRRYRIHQDRTTTAIVTDLFSQIPGLTIRDDVREPLPPRDFCVQYHESDLALITRILADDGIGYLIEDPDDADASTFRSSSARSSSARSSSSSATILRLFDSNAGLDPVDPGVEHRIIEDRFDEADEESIQTLCFTLRAPSPEVIATDWDWKGATPVVHEERFPTAPSDTPPAFHAAHVHEPLGRGGGLVAQASARFEHERYVADDILGHGRSNATTFSAGRHVTVHIAGDAPLRLLLTKVIHYADCPEAELGATASGGAPNYTNTFECQPLDIVHRPRRQLDPPQIHGLQTATVVGPPNEEIHTDHHGRIRVRMHWDRHASSTAASAASSTAPTADTDASCWLRVAQSWAGQGFGAMVIPRVGMEVLVAFLDGDPDRPICVGCVYNGAHRPPYPLPDEKTKTTFRSSSTPGGEGYNELTFEDRTGGEQVLVHAQRDLIERVRHDHTSTIGHDRTAAVRRNDTLSVGGDQQTTIDGNQTVVVHGGGKIGTPGSTAAIEGALEVRVTKPGHVLVDAAASITFQCGASSIVMDPKSIRIVAGDGTFANLGTDATVVSAAGATAQISDAVALRSAAGGTLQLDASFAAGSAVGSTFELDAAAVTTASGGARFTLDQSALLEGLRIVASTLFGSALDLGEDATLTGLVATRCLAGGPTGGALTVDATGVGLRGTKVDVAATALAQVMGKLVKIN